MSILYSKIDLLIVLRFNDTSTLVGQFVSSPREREKKSKEIIEEMKERDREERNRNESEETEEINYIPLPLPATRIAGLAHCTPISVGQPGNIKRRHLAPPDHPRIVRL